MYNQLPSTVAAQATTFDLIVTDVLSAWEHHRQNPSDQTQYKTENLEEILKNAKG